MSAGPARAVAGLAPTFLCFVLLWAALDRTADLLGSTRGEWGLLICGLVLGAALVCEWTLSRPRGDVRRTLGALGLRAPSAGAIIWALSLGALLLLFFPLFAAVTHAPLRLYADAPALAIGIFAQGGFAEELVFRGFLFRRLRVGRSFWRAASLAAIPFAAVHALLFFTLDAPVALAALTLSLSMSFPLAWLFERAGGAIWPPAIVHAVAQGAIKLVEAGDGFPSLALAWMGLCAIAPWLVFFLRPMPR
jgi:membrane protease YdiL (CAAX protease family)